VLTFLGCRASGGLGLDVLGSGGGIALILGATVAIFVAFLVDIGVGGVNVGVGGCAWCRRMFVVSADVCGVSGCAWCRYNHGRSRSRQ